MSNKVTGMAVLPLVAEIVCAYVRHNSVPSDGLPGLIRLVRETLANLAVKGVPHGPLVPAVPIKQSVFPNYLICLEDGRMVKVLKPYLARVHDLTPAEYRRRWGLPFDYPMVAPSFSAARSALSIARGFGRRPAEAVPEPVPEPAAAPVQRVAKRGRGKRSVETEGGG